MPKQMAKRMERRVELKTNIKNQFQLIRELAKSGIVTLVLISVLAGYLIGQPTELPFDWKRMTLTLIGILFLASGSSALNQYQERQIDAQMPRTANRPLPSGRIRPSTVLLFVGVTLIAGLSILFQLSLTLFILGILAAFSYNVLYTLWWKKYWAYGAVPGAIPGALPILMGHTAAQGQVLNPGGLYLFFILFFWQMPHFWALALRYRKDYEQGGFPTLPVKLGEAVTLDRIILWCLAYLGVAFIAPLFLRVGWLYLIPTLLVSIKVLWELYGFAKKPESQKWLHFFLWVNFSLIIYLGAAVLDLWSIYIPFLHNT
jgi:protoheme IX farnesyltransferase